MGGGGGFKFCEDYLVSRIVFGGLTVVGVSKLSKFELITNGQSTVGGPKWTKWTCLGQNGPKWTILVHFGLANAKLRFGIRPFWPKWSFGPFWTILVQYTFRQYRDHSLVDVKAPILLLGSYLSFQATFLLLSIPVGCQFRPRSTKNGA